MTAWIRITVKCIEHGEEIAVATSDNAIDKGVELLSYGCRKCEEIAELRGFDKAVETINEEFQK